MKAFPRMSHTDCFGYKHPAEEGMDLRDYFAAKAMQAIMTNSKTYFPKIAELSEKSEESADLIMAKLSYVYADSMMKARAV